MACQVVVSDGPTAWKALSGLFCVYKPFDKSVRAVKAAIVTNIVKTMNELQPRPIAKFVSIEGPPDDLGVTIRNDYADHPLVVGPRYQMEDVKLTWATTLGKSTSGVLVMAVNSGVRLANKFHEARPLRTYRLKGILGHVTDNMFFDGKILGKASFKHVQAYHVEKVLAQFQAAHQKQMFVQSGVDIQSQTAYELAVRGLVRPGSKEVPLIYGLKMLEFQPPHFTIEVQSINEYEDYLKKLIHDIGGRLRTLATCTGLQCIKHGCFTTEHSLLRKHWTTEHIINGISQCQRVMRETNFTFDHQPFLVSDTPRRKEESVVV